MKLEPGEELIGTITPHGIRLTRDTQRAQRAYRERAREREEARDRLRPSHRSVELRISWSSDAPLRVHVVLARWLVPASPRLEATRRSERVAVGPGKAPEPGRARRQQVGRISR